MPTARARKSAKTPGSQTHPPPPPAAIATGTYKVLLVASIEPPTCKLNLATSPSLIHLITYLHWISPLPSTACCTQSAGKEYTPEQVEVSI